MYNLLIPYANDVALTILTHQLPSTVNRYVLLSSAILIPQELRLIGIHHRGCALSRLVSLRLYMSSSHSLASMVAVVLLRERLPNVNPLVMTAKITKIPALNTTIVTSTSINVIPRCRFSILIL